MLLEHQKTEVSNLKCTYNISPREYSITSQGEVSTKLHCVIEDIKGLFDNRFFYMLTLSEENQEM